MQNTVYLVTTNEAKFKSYKHFFEGQDIELKKLEMNVFEPQSFDPKEIIISKIDQVKFKYPNIKFIVDDRSAFIPALGGFPGPYLKPAISTLGSKGFLRLMHGLEDRRIIFATAIGYCDSIQNHIFIHKENGKIVKEEKGRYLRGWSEILRIYSTDNLPNKTVAEMNNVEWQTHIESNNFMKLIHPKFFELLKSSADANINSKTKSTNG